MKKARQGDLIYLKGYLLYIEASDGWRWKSSLKRNDTGNGSCELIWVKEFEIKNVS